MSYENAVQLVRSLGKIVQPSEEDEEVKNNRSDLLVPGATIILIVPTN